MKDEEMMKNTVAKLIKNKMSRSAGDVRLATVPADLAQLNGGRDMERITGIEADVIFLYGTTEYKVTHDDCTIFTSTDFHYGADIDGHRGERRSWIDDCQFDLEEMTIHTMPNGDDMWVELTSPTQPLVERAYEELRDWLLDAKRLEDI